MRRRALGYPLTYLCNIKGYIKGRSRGDQTKNLNRPYFPYAFALAPNGDGSVPSPDEVQKVALEW
jgi:hypothetical protein